ncbi:MAG: hypothetical protein A3E98_00160 [Candidatus Doudnabacteria bacterium RIFCSPHIGHO2_12_FULL_48_11]|uniref:DUF1573 domain-containing protein n=1 Tax=Candidatus Doudnabacteria bacterium RIFCSPHIGHO2_01_FULL_46_24 TaxID=1817825 RepID=A0A1F5NUQ4_9BACT|nr:MAG: hypothetical protein A2720_02515 [Candidatus Doudnabacteria bacterium RIFCSPHIGHO2_01_FULL_46_24]OGE94223.1 MAG: hypothetical protein A3E98_00160 [Candidatus Doudnabacteria bacterium RIFCSPHIGHO2_12_FULL_48_11]
MKLKQIFYLIAALVVILGFAGFLKSKQPAESATAPPYQSSAVAASETFYDFGSVPINGGKVTKIFKVKNNSETKVTVKEMHTSCMCTEASLKLGDQSFGPFGMPGHASMPQINAAFPAQSEAEIEVVFDPAAHGPAGIGVIERLVTLETSDGKLQLSIKASVIP